MALPKIIVGGFPNSGTSFLCHLVSKMGFSPGPLANLKGPDKHNRWGYRESLPIQRLAWEAGGIGAVIRIAEVDTFPDEPLRLAHHPHRKLIREMAGSDEVEVYKDCAIGFHYKLFSPNARYVLINRDVRRIYESGVGYEEPFEDICASYIAYYHLVALFLSKERKTIMVRYEDFAKDFIGTTDGIARFLGLALSPKQLRELRPIWRPRRKSE